MSKLADIGRLLSHLRLKLIQYSGEQGLTVGDPEFPRKIDELNRMNETVGLSMRELKSALHAANLREQGLWTIPRDNRYGPTASAKDQKRQIDDLLRDAAEVQALVEKLLGRICSGNEMEGVDTVAKLIELATGHESGTAEQVLPKYPAYVPASQAHLQASPENAVIMAYVAIRGLVIVSKKIAARIRRRTA